MLKKLFACSALSWVLTMVPATLQAYELDQQKADEIIRRGDVQELVKDIRFLLNEGVAIKFTFDQFPPDFNNVDREDPEVVEFLKWTTIFQEKQHFSKYGDFRDLLWRLAWKRLTDEEKTKYFDITISYNIRSQNLAQRFLGNVFEFPWMIEESLTDLMAAVPAVPQGVKWDGENEQFQYEDRQLRATVIKIAATLKQSTSETRPIIKQVPKEILKKFQFNSQLDTPESKTEPFDLVQGEITRRAYMGEYFTKNVEGGITLNRIILTKMVHRSLHKSLMLSPENDAWGAGLDDMLIFPGEDKYTILCAGNVTLTSRRADGAMSSRTGWGFPTKLSINQTDLDAGLAEQNSSKLICDEQAYDVKKLITLADPLTIPKDEPLIFTEPEAEDPENPVKALVSFALQSESTPEFLQVVRTYMGMLGYEIAEEQDQVESLSFFKEQVLDSDIVIPIAHGLSFYNFHIGNEFSKVIKFTKTIVTQTGKKQAIDLYAMFPASVEGSIGYQTIETDELSDLFYQRILDDLGSLFIMNASCWSEKTVFPWTKAYRQAALRSLDEGVISSISDLDSTPHVFGSSRSFPTSSFSQLIGNFAHPVHTIESLAEGKTVATVHEQLKVEAPEIYMETARRLMELTGGNEVIENRPYIPVYNIDVPGMLTIGDIDYDFIPIEFDK